MVFSQVSSQRRRQAHVCVFKMNLSDWSAHSPTLRFQVFHSGVSLVGGEYGNLLAVGSFGRGDDFVL